MKRWGQEGVLAVDTRAQARMCSYCAATLLSLLCFMLVWATSARAAANAVAPAQESPAKALENVQSALDTGDLVLFDLHVDMDRLVGRGVDYFLAEAQNDKAKSSMPPVLSMILSTVGQSETGKTSFRSLVGGEARNFVVYGVQSGSFAGNKLANVPPPEGLLAPLFAEASLGRKEIRQVQSPKMRGSDCLISFVVYDYGNGRSYPVQSLWQVVQGHWRLVQVENLPALITQIRGEAEE